MLMLFQIWVNLASKDCHVLVISNFEDRLGIRFEWLER